MSSAESDLGRGGQPHRPHRPLRAPSLEPLRAYAGEDVRLRLPSGLALAQLHWLALFDVARGHALASVLLPDAPNVPPALSEPHPYSGSLPHCRQLHRDLQVSWEVFGNQITLQLAGQVPSPTCALCGFCALRSSTAKPPPAALRISAVVGAITMCHSSIELNRSF